MKKIYNFQGYSFPHGRSLFAVGRRAVSFLLVCLIIVSLFPGINNTEAAGDSGPSQTKYSDINAFQNAQIAEIQEAIFNQKPRDGQPEPDPDVVQKWTVNENNAYFSWTDTSSFTDKEGNTLSPWNGRIIYDVGDYEELFPGDGGIGSLIWKYKYKKPLSFDESNASFEYENEYSYAEYIVFNIRTPEQFRYAMEYTMRGEAEGKNILINLLNDLDMGGKDNKLWEPIKICCDNAADFVGSGKPYPSTDTTGVNSIYIEGNGYTIYNLRVKSASAGDYAGNNGGLFADVNCPLIVKNLGFKSSMVIAKGKTGLIYGRADSEKEADYNKFTYLYNVHSSDCYMQTDANYAGGLIGETFHTCGLFVKNCSTNNVIVYGKGHVSGFASYTRICTETDLPCAVGYNQEFPKHPEWAAFDLGSYKDKCYFPAMFEDSYSVNCEIFSTGIDSGCFISCGGNIIARNCYTNNSIYSDSNTGGFIGRTELDEAMMLGVQDTPSCVSCYFENCYSSGVVEGRNAMGGFVGFVNSARSNGSSYKIDDSKFLDLDNVKTDFKDGKHNFGDFATAVFVNCYTTASVGMDYAGRYCGGFVGLDDNYSIGNEIIVDGKPVEFNGTAYINCYAAGEVGNILTVTDTSNADQNTDQYWYYEGLYIEAYEGYDNKQDGTVEILPYYPTGGFIGVLCPERWWIARAVNYEGNKYLTFTPKTSAESSFAGSDVELEKYKVYNKSFGYFDNCYYDMQTTAMREMAIGMAGGDYAPLEGTANEEIYGDVDFNFKTCQGSADKPFSVVGITGVYTEKSDVKGVDGLTDFPNGHNMNGDVWQYEKGYYPQLKVFMTDDDVSSTAPDAKWKESVFYVKEQQDIVSTVSGAGEVREFKRSCDGDTFKNEIMVERAFRFSQASTAAVMLNHWDYKMNTSNGELYDAYNPDGFEAGAEVYDTVRDITSDFEFTSGIKSKQRGISWEIDKDRIEKYDYFEHFGGDKGFSLKYVVDGKNITGTFNETILELNTEVITNEGTNYNHYTCTDFSPGKQFLRISTYGYGDESNDYNTWQTDYLAYMKYQKDLEAFNNAAKIYYAVIGDQIAEWLEQTVPGYDPETTPTNTPEYLMGYLEYLQTQGNSYEKGYYKDLARIYGDVINLYKPVKEYLDEHDNDDSEPELAVNDVLVVGTRGIRLLPQAYLEAGNDAEVNVVEDRFNKESNVNNVSFGKNSSSGIEFKSDDGKSISDLSFSYYNFALTAAYAVTDKIGLGIYDNYSNQASTGGDQGIVGYDKTLLREMDDPNKREAGTYFAMSSVFSKNSVYEANEGVRSTQGTGLSKENHVAYDLSVDELSDMNMIGDSYGDGTDNVGQTIVKVYKVDDNGERTRVNMDPYGQGNEEYFNYCKWSGMAVFEPEDIGNYVVAFYWIMPDGRYYTDEKKVTVLSITPGIVKTVDKQYDEVTGKNELTYTITYTNNLSADPVTFALFDILPFEGDVRYDTAEQNNKKTDITQREQDDEFSLKLDSIDVIMDSYVSVKGVYYTTDEKVRKYMSSSGDMMNTDAAKSDNLGLKRADSSAGGSNEDAGTIDTEKGGIDWKVFKPVQNARATYRPEDQKEQEFQDKGKGATAVVVSGVQLEPNKSITIVIKVSYKGEAGDYLVNNAFNDILYKNTNGEDAEFAGYSEPVTTTIVKRQLSGYVWADKDKDGIYDGDEQVIEGMPVTLKKLSEDGITWEDTSYSDESDATGYYSFDSVPENGTFRIVFTKPKSGKLTVRNSDGTGTPRTVNYDDFLLSTVLDEETVNGKIGSNNLAKELESAEGGYYIDSITMPEAQQICEDAEELQESIKNSKIEKSVFTKSYQNLALYENYGSITVHKVNEDRNNLEGVVFKLEYYDDDGNTWKPITYTDGYPIYGDSGGYADELPTGGDGKLSFANLRLSKAKKYRITELKTLDGYNLLAGPIEIELPYAVKKDEAPPSGFEPSVTYDYEKDGYYYYKDVTITVTNTKKINELLPRTGGESGFDPKIFVGVILVIVGVGILCYALFRKSPKSKR